MRDSQFGVTYQSAPAEQGAASRITLSSRSATHVEFVTGSRGDISLRSCCSEMAYSMATEGHGNEAGTSGRSMWRAGHSAIARHALCAIVPVP